MFRRLARRLGGWPEGAAAPSPLSTANVAAVGLPQEAAAPPPLSTADVVGVYRLFLGRDPETSQTVADKLHLTPTELLRQILSSEEIRLTLVAPISARILPPGLSLAGPHFEQTKAWAAGFLPLSPDVSRELPSALTRLTALGMVLKDPAMVRALGEFPGLFDAKGFLKCLDEVEECMGARSLVGAIDAASATEVRGFIFNELAPTELLSVELWIDGTFAGAAIADGYRSDLEERYISSGRHVFSFENYITFDVAPDHALRVEIRESGSKLSLGAQMVTPRARRDAQQLVELSRQLGAARRTLDEIDRSLKSMGGSFGYTLEDWDTYWRTFYIRTPLAVAREAEVATGFRWRPRFEVIVPVLDPDVVNLTDTIRSLEAQSYSDFNLQAVRLAASAGDLDGAPFPEIAIAGDYVVILPTGDRLAPGALHAIAAALQDETRPRLIYPDADRILRQPNSPERHADPTLRPDFDPDLLLQTPYLGRLVIAESALLRQALENGAELSPGARNDLWFRLTETTSAGEVKHIARVLHHESGFSPPPTPPAEYLETVRAHLTRVDSPAKVVLTRDALLPDSTETQLIRIQWPLRGDRPRAAVIIPTRDRIDLLQPCLTSLIQTRRGNTVELEIIVVDNGSTEPQTLEILKALATEEEIRVMDYPHPFNWSAINNHAARNTSAEVLVFLNNDTVILTPDWCDELYRQTMRPEVGAVGSRMLYVDGAIQHAGIILGCRNAIGLHEGAGAPLSDPGYLGRRNLVHRSAALTGACLATRSEVFHRLGGFDEVNLAVNANDMDYCLRVRQAGLAAVYDPRCTIYHFESKSRGHTLLDEARRTRSEREMNALAQRWGEYVRFDPFFNPHFDRLSQPFTRLAAPEAAEG
jgi:O-antigen biosynthesis protein